MNIIAYMAIAKEISKNIKLTRTYEESVTVQINLK